VNHRVAQLLGLRNSEQILIEDFVNWNMQTIQGKVPRPITASPNDQTIHGYLMTLKSELDAFLGDYVGVSHTVDATYDGISAIIAIATKKGTGFAPSVFSANERATKSLARAREHLLKQHSQWLYFTRNLRIYADNTMYMFKPMEQIQWTRRQAILDAGEVISETLGQQN